MENNPNSLTFEKLNSLKYKELHKLSVQFKVNKRWATKQDIIKNLMQLKDHGETEEKANGFGDDCGEWQDGAKAFTDLADPSKGDTASDKRLTFTLEPSKEVTDPRATFDVPRTKQTLLVANDSDNLNDSRLTFDIPQIGKLTETSDILNNTSHGIEQRGSPVMNKEKSNLQEFLSARKHHPEIKMLTIPITRVMRRKKDINEEFKCSLESNLKISNKSITIKKQTDMTKSPHRLRLVRGGVQTRRLSGIKSEVLEEGAMKIGQLPLVKQVSSKKLELSSRNFENKENMESTRRRKSKTEDNALIKTDGNIKHGVAFRTPQSAGNSHNKSYLRKSSPGKLMSKIPKAKPNATNIKPITSTKMPDFASIHKRRFEQMDSLHDYQRKKAERARKLFGTPQPRVPTKFETKTVTSTFQFTSSNIPVRPDVKFSKCDKVVEKPMSFKINAMESKTKEKESVKYKVPPSRARSDIKEKNRTHIYGVRTNKRFELQMKFRNLQD